MGDIMPHGVTLTPLRRIEEELGSVYHCLKSSDTGFAGFGEAYFSTVKFGAVKGWKKHLYMTLNLAVVIGNVRFVICDEQVPTGISTRYFQVDLHPENYYRLTVSPGIWMAFQGLDSPENILINIASIPHDPAEQVNAPLTDPQFSDYVWS